MIVGIIIKYFDQIFTPCNIIVQFKFPFEHASKMRIGFASFRSTTAYRIIIVVVVVLIHFRLKEKNVQRLESAARVLPNHK